jgi:hypothetical protein
MVVMTMMVLLAAFFAFCLSPQSCCLLGLSCLLFLFDAEGL